MANTKTLRGIFLSVISIEIIQAAAELHGLQLRLRKKDVVKLIVALILAAANGDGGRQVAVLKKILKKEAPWSAGQQLTSGSTKGSQKS